MTNQKPNYATHAGGAMDAALARARRFTRSLGDAVLPLYVLRLVGEREQWRERCQQLERDLERARDANAATVEHMRAIRKICLDTLDDCDRLIGGMGKANDAVRAAQRRAARYREAAIRLRDTLALWIGAGEALRELGQRRAAAERKRDGTTIDRCVVPQLYGGVLKPCGGQLVEGGNGRCFRHWQAPCPCGGDDEDPGPHAPSCPLNDPNYGDEAPFE